VRLAGALAALGILVAACSSTTAGEATEERPAKPREGLRFADVSADVGLDWRHGAFRWQVSPDPPAMMGGGVCWLDYDGDGWLDLFVVNSFAEAEAGRWREAGGLPQTALYRNVGGRFADVGAKTGTNLAVRGNGCVAADLDSDGHTDLYVTTSRVNALLWNNGDGTFTEGAVAAGVAAYGWRTGAAVGDVNGDDRPDLFVAGYADLANPDPEATKGFPNTYRGVRDLLFLGSAPDESGRPSFREVGVAAGLEAARFEYGLGALLVDLDRDGDLDLYVANDTNPNRLYENVPWPGGVEADPFGLGFRFEERAARAGVADANAGMGVAGGDYDANGRPDLFVTNADRQLHAVFGSLPPSPDEPSFEDARADFRPALRDTFTGWGVSWGDLDLDTDLDLFVVNGAVPVTDLASDAQPVQLFGNVGGRFEDFTREASLGAVGAIVGRGSAAADYDNDGDLDFAVVSIGGSLVLLENQGSGGNWLEVQLEGFHPGAVVTARLPDGRALHRDVLAGSSYLSSEDPRSHFGLGEAREVRELVVRWPGGGESRLTDVRANQLVVVGAP
jgi:hypothetical protein